jgi:hypothetical protein
MLARFQWYRRWRGGKWARVTGLFWGKNWVRIPDESVERAEEHWVRIRRSERQSMERRILLAIHEFGLGPSATEIRLNLQLEGPVDPEHFYVALGRLVEEGMVAEEKLYGRREHNYRTWYAYQITERGLDELKGENL